MTPRRRRTALDLPAPLADFGARDVALGAAPLVAGTIVGLATNSGGTDWYRGLSKPSWTPPDAVFGPVWSVLYLLMGTASVLVARAGRTLPKYASEVAQPSTDRALGAFAVQLVLNLGWSVLFFGLRRPRAAGVELVALWAGIAATVIAFARVPLAAGLLLLPYLAWTSFAGLLNAEIIRRNPRA
jgi:translocator protein